jgi:hypothetical protein
MRSKLLGILILFFGYINLNACSTTPTKRNPKENKTLVDTNLLKVNFDTTILLIDRKCEKCESWDALFYFKDFNNIYEHGTLYLADALSFLSNERYNDKQKKICICSMQRAALKDYIEIVNKCKKLFDEGKMPEDILAWAVAPNFSNKYLIVRNYNDDSVKKLLNKIYLDKKTSQQLKETIEEILSGALWNSIKESEGK